MNYAIFSSLFLVLATSSVGGYKREAWSSTRQIISRLSIGGLIGLAGVAIFTGIFFGEPGNAELLGYISLVVGITYILAMLGRFAIKRMPALRSKIRPPRCRSWSRTAGRGALDQF